MESFSFFAANLIDPIFLLFQVMDDPEHPVYTLLQKDLAAVDADELETYAKAHHLDDHVARMADKDLGKRGYFLVNRLHKAIAAERLKLICSEETLVDGYLLCSNYL